MQMLYAAVVFTIIANHDNISVLATLLVTPCAILTALDRFHENRSRAAFIWFQKERWS
jgi:hypothetical protein